VRFAGPLLDPPPLAVSGAVALQASLVVTHAGRGTVMSSLAAGVPLLCIPFGRDQFYNAARVEALRVGAVAPREASPETLRAAVEALLANGEIRSAAARFATVIRGYANGEPAVQAVEALARRTTAAVECAE
jgi:UDP:flavonoid glycosyltransferase YjiC (YdhE family)